MSAVLEKQASIPARLAEEFPALLKKTFASEPEWLKEKRKEAFEAFSKAGIPTRKNEEYKYTDIRKIFSGNFSAVHNEEHKLNLDFNKISVDKDSIKLVFVNGWLYKDSTLTAKLPKGVSIGNMAGEGLARQDSLRNYLGLALGPLPEKESWQGALNSALWFDGAYIYLPADSVLEKTIEIIHICTGKEELLITPRHLIIAGKNSAAQIIEHSISMGAAARILVNSVAEVFVGENAKLNYYKIQNGNRNIFHLHSTVAVQKQNSHFDTNTVTLDSDWVRNSLNISLEGENCETHLNGLFLTADAEFVDNHTRVYHGKAHCQSNQLYKGILDGKSTGIFNGKIYVEKDAQKTNAYQSSKNILLTDDAAINTKPELEIYADDVKCSHGSSTGKLDREALFYLRARGLSEASSRKLLLHAFASDVLNTVRIEGLNGYLEELIEKKLNG